MVLFTSEPKEYDEVVIYHRPYDSDPNTPWRYVKLLKVEDLEFDVTVEDDEREISPYHIVSIGSRLAAVKFSGKAVPDYGTPQHLIGTVRTVGGTEEVTASDIARRYRDDTNFMRAVQRSVNEAERCLGEQDISMDMRRAMILTAGHALWDTGPNERKTP